MFLYHGKQIRSAGFLGLGKSNEGIIRYLLSKYGNIPCTLRSAADTDCHGFNFQRKMLGKDMLSDITEDILFISPSARRDAPELCEAAERGVILSSDAELFFSGCESDVYAVTGSDGKSTTTYLTSMLLSGGYSRSVACGNIGEAMTPYTDCGRDTAIVTELSSFQLMYLKPRSRRAVITNISENHLNWHKSFEEYVEAKRNIFDATDGIVINYDCPLSRSCAEGKDVYAVFSKALSADELISARSAEHYVTLEDGYIAVDKARLLDVKSIRVGGEHNILNFMAAIAMSYGKCGVGDIRALAEGFGGLRHRRELIGEFYGVRYYDSSIDSSPKRCSVTLASFDKRVSVILGGRSKGLDFRELLPALKAKAKRVIATGECGEEIIALLRSDGELASLGIPCSYLRGFESAVEYAVRTAEAGDSVLLSPAATSYDEFNNFEERGDAFSKIVKNLNK